MKAVVYQGVGDIRRDLAADPRIEASADAIASCFVVQAIADTYPASDATRMQSYR